MSETNLSYWSVRTNSWTFSNTKIRAWVESHLSGRVLNACCGVCQLDHDGETVRNDIRKEVTLEKARTINGTEYEAGDTVSTNTDLNVPAEDLLDHLDAEGFDTIVWDPPFSEHQAEQTYNLDGVDAESSRPIHETLDKLLKPGGTLITFGFSSAVMPEDYGYETESLSLWNLFGGQFDWVSTAIQKPTKSADRTSSKSSNTVFTSQDDVLPNTGASDFDAVTGATGGNDGHPINITYHRFAAGTDLREKAYELISDEIAGTTLSLSHHDPSVTADSTVVKNSLDAHGEGDTHYDAQRISDEFHDESFENVIVDPAPEAYQNQIDYFGSKNIQASVLKYESHPLLRIGGRVIQVGHMATCMNSRLPYRRDSITILSATDAPRDYIITTDEKQPEWDGQQYGVNSVRDLISKQLDRSAESCPVCESKLIGDGTCLQCGADVGTEYLCWTCGEGSYLHPVWYVDCLECGAAPDNFCFDHDTGKVLREPHQERIERYEEKHANCGSEPVKVREPPVSIVEQADGGAQQTSLTGF
jgi:hypothetical protein